MASLGIYIYFELNSMYIVICGIIIISKVNEKFLKSRKNKVIIIMDSEMPYFLIWSLSIKRLVHHVVNFICPCLVSCPFYTIPIILYPF